MNVPPGISAELSNINYKTKKKMKKTILLASFVIATLFAFSSCQKENLQDNGSTNGVRIITAEFENNATKTTLNSDGVTPEWKAGDVIRILNATTYQDVVLVSEENPLAEGRGIIEDGKIVIAIDDEITGTLYAVYPATATSMKSCPDGEITFAIPAVQDGTFGSANICVAKGDDKDNLMFSNATAVLEFSQDSPSSTGVIRVAVDAANNIAGTLTAEFDENNKATLTATGLTSKSIFTEAASSAKDKYYIAIAPGTTGAVGFKYYKALKEASDTKSSATLERNKIYALSIPDSGYENSYVEITADYDNDPNTDPTTLKWAKVNIGATKPEDYGHYFAWGYTDGCVRNSTNNGWVSVSDMTAKQFNKTTDFPNRSKTESTFEDAASVNWGGSWSMPTPVQFEKMKAVTYWAWDDTDKGCYVFSPDDTHTAGSLGNDLGDLSKANALLFFPATGLGNSDDFIYQGTYGYYWENEPNGTEPTNNAWCLYIKYISSSLGITAIGSAYKYCGTSIRPVSN